MVELQKCYDAYEGPTVESVGEGKFYAGKFKDDIWYRYVILSQIIKLFS